MFEYLSEGRHCDALRRSSCLFLDCCNTQNNQMKCVISLPKTLRILPSRAGEVDYSCRAQQLVPSTYVGWFTCAITLTPEDLMLFWLLWVPEHTCTKNTQNYIYINLSRHQMKQCLSRIIAQREVTCIACTKWCVLSPALQRKGLRQLS